MSAPSKSDKHKTPYKYIYIYVLSEPVKVEAGSTTEDVTPILPYVISIPKSEERHNWLEEEFVICSYTATTRRYNGYSETHGQLSLVSIPE